jgi:DNA invertase Pin-like site-specific DNA recombinase
MVERSMVRQRINAGLKRAVEAGKTLGRIQEQLRAG